MILFVKPNRGVLFIQSPLVASTPTPPRGGGIGWGTIEPFKENRDDTKLKLNLALKDDKELFEIITSILPIILR